MPDKVIFYIVLSLMIIGVVFSYSLSPYLMVRFHTGELNYVLKQLIFAIMSIFIIWSISRLEPEKWMHRIGMTLFLGGLFLMVIMNFLPKSFVPEVGGASRWISIFGLFSIAPVEFFKIGFIYFISWSMSRKVEINKRNRFISEFRIFFPYFLVFMVAVMFITVIQKDLGQSVVLGTALIILSYLAGGSGSFIFKVILSLLLIFVGLIVTFGHRVDRIASWWVVAKSWFPEWMIRATGDVSGAEPYQIQQALNSITHGGFFGVGLGNGVFKYGFLSEVHTDFVLEGIAEELGLFAIIVIFILFTALIQRILKVANRSYNRVFFLFNVGIAVSIGVTLLINTYGATSLLPMKGIPVPFLSYGGSSMFALAFGIGMVLMTSKMINREDQEKKLQEYRANSQDYVANDNRNYYQDPPYQNSNHTYQRYQEETQDFNRSYFKNRPYHEKREF